MTIKEECDKIVERYKPFAEANYVYGEADLESNIENATQCAISECEAIIEALTEYGEESMQLQNMDRTFAYYESLLTELKSRI